MNPISRASTTHTADSVFCTGRNLAVLATGTGFTSSISSSFAVDSVKAINLQFIGVTPPTALHLAGSELIT